MADVTEVQGQEGAPADAPTRGRGRGRGGPGQNRDGGNRARRYPFHSSVQCPNPTRGASVPVVSFVA